MALEMLALAQADPAWAETGHGLSAMAAGVHKLDADPDEYVPGGPRSRPLACQMQHEEFLFASRIGQLI